MSDQSNNMEVEETSEEEVSNQALSRRKAFSVLGLASLVSAACADSNFGGLTKGGKKRKGDSIDETGQGDDDDDHKNGLEFGTEGDGGGLGDGSQTSCHANTTTEVDMSKFNDLADGDKPQVVFYGKNAEKTDTTMVAMKFASLDDIKAIIIADDKGRLHALHGITAADKDGVIVIDNLYLSGVTAINILVQKSKDRLKATEAISYFDTFNNMPVVNLGERAFAAQQSLPVFAANRSQMKADDKILYPNVPGATEKRPLNTAQANTTYAASGLKGTLTDIMGNALDASDSLLIKKHQVLCTYFTSGAEVFRTIFRVG